MNINKTTNSQNNAGGLSYENQAFLVIGHQMMFAVLIEDSHRGGVNKKPVRRP